MRHICAAKDPFAATGVECATGRIGTGYFCHACTMGTGIFYNGTTSKRGRTKEVASANAILVANAIAVNNMRYSHGMLVLKIEL